jgi:hypothetical protein
LLNLLIIALLLRVIQKDPITAPYVIVMDSIRTREAFEYGRKVAW